MPANDWIHQQFFLEDDPELKRQVYIKHWNVDRESMIDRNHSRLRDIDILQSADPHRRGDSLHNQLRPKSGEAVQDTFLLAEQRNRDRNDSEDDGVEPDQRIKDKVRAQAAAPTILLSGSGRADTGVPGPPRSVVGRRSLR